MQSLPISVSQNTRNSVQPSSEGRNRDGDTPFAAFLSQSEEAQPVSDDGKESQQLSEDTDAILPGGKPLPVSEPKAAKTGNEEPELAGVGDEEISQEGVDEKRVLVKPSPILASEQAKLTAESDPAQAALTSQIILAQLAEGDAGAKPAPTSGNGLTEIQQKLTLKSGEAIAAARALGNEGLSAERFTSQTSQSAQGQIGSIIESVEGEKSKSALSEVKGLAANAASTAKSAASALGTIALASGQSETSTGQGKTGSELLQMLQAGLTAGTSASEQSGKTFSESQAGVLLDGSAAAKIGSSTASTASSQLAQADRSAELAALVDRLVEGRVQARADRRQIEIPHQDFGRVTLSLNISGKDGLSVDLPGAPTELRQAMSQALASNAGRSDGQSASSNNNNQDQLSQGRTQNGASGEGNSTEQNQTHNTQDTEAESRRGVLA